jgi:hypothetical protein
MYDGWSTDLKNLVQFLSLVVKNVLSLNHLVQTKLLGSTVNPEMSIVCSSAITKQNTNGELWSWNVIWFGQLSCMSNFIIFSPYKLNCQNKRKKLSIRRKIYKLHLLLRNTRTRMGEKIACELLNAHQSTDC